MRRTILTASIAVLLLPLAACTNGRPGSQGGDPSSASSGPDQYRLRIYEAVIRSQIEFGDQRVWVLDRICPNAGRGGAGGGHGKCPEAFSPGEQDALLEALTDVPTVRFVHDTRPLTQRIFDGRRHGQIVRVGPIVERGGRVEVPASHYCGGLCGGGSVWSVERDEDGWTVTGPAPGHGAWVS
jgi:hypothetical protein